MKQVKNLTALFAVLAFISYLLLIFINPEPTMEQKQVAVMLFICFYITIAIIFSTFKDIIQK